MSASSRVILVATIVTGMAACQEPSHPTDDYERREGAGCGELLSDCEDEETLWECVDRRWKRINCIDACSDRGGLTACLADSETFRSARCWCSEDVAGCDFSQDVCVSDGMVRMCDAETLMPVEMSCDEICSAMEPPRIATKCSFGVCGCTLVGTACLPDSAPRCEPFAIARCVDGIWDVESCLCSPGECDPWGTEGPACIC